MADKWAWDKEHIKQYHELHEPYDSYEELMLSKARKNPYWLEMWASYGKVERRVLPSGLVLLTRKAARFEQYVLADSGEVLDFQHEPKDYSVYKPTQLASEQFLEKAEELLRKITRAHAKHDNLIEWITALGIHAHYLLTIEGGLGEL